MELGPKARVLGNVHYGTIESAVGAQINGKLIHRTLPPDSHQPGAVQPEAGAAVAPEGEASL